MNCKAVWAGITFATLALLTAQEEAFRGALSQYLALDDEGVTVGRSTFHHFRLLPLQEGARGISARFVEVVPLVDLKGKPGFRFEIKDGATIDDFFELRFTFEVSGPGFTGAHIELNNVTVRGSSNASADVVLDLAATGNQAGSLASLITLAAPGGFGMLQDEGTFSSPSGLSVEFDAVLDGGGGGAPGVVVASVDSVSVTFTEVLPEPEPAPLIVKNSGLTRENHFFIEFTSTPSSRHFVVASITLAEGFPIQVTPIGGAPVTDASGYGRTEIDLSTFPSAAFFAIKSSS